MDNLDNWIVKSFRSGLTIESITKTLSADNKIKGIKSNKHDCKNQVETAILNHILSNKN